MRHLSQQWGNMKCCYGTVSEGSKVTQKGRILVCCGVSIITSEWSLMRGTNRAAKVARPHLCQFFWNAVAPIATSHFVVVAPWYSAFISSLTMPHSSGIYLPVHIVCCSASDTQTCGRIMSHFDHFVASLLLDISTPFSLSESVSHILAWNLVVLSSARCE